MSDELRDEYVFDYQKARPNRFATRSQAEGGTEAPSSQTPPFQGLTGEQAALLEQLYAQTPLSVDDLPYSDEMEQLHREFIQRTGLSISLRELYKSLRNLGRRGRPGGKFRTPPTAPR